MLRRKCGTISGRGSKPLTWERWTAEEQSRMGVGILPLFKTRVPGTDFETDGQLLASEFESLDERSTRAGAILDFLRRQSGSSRGARW